MYLTPDHSSKLCRVGRVAADLCPGQRHRGRTVRYTALPRLLGLPDTCLLHTSMESSLHTSPCLPSGQVQGSPCVNSVSLCPARAVACPPCPPCPASGIKSNTGLLTVRLIERKSRTGRMGDIVFFVTFVILDLKVFLFAVLSLVLCCQWKCARVTGECAGPAGEVEAQPPSGPAS